MYCSALAVSNCDQVRRDANRLIIRSHYIHHQFSKSPFLKRYSFFAFPAALYVAPIVLRVTRPTLPSFPFRLWKGRKSHILYRSTSTKYHYGTVIQTPRDFVYLLGYTRPSFWIGASLYYARIVVLEGRNSSAGQRIQGGVVGQHLQTAFDNRVREPGVEEYL